MTDWEHRYRELLPEYDGTEQENIRLALQLGREMADERAEEIALRCEELADVARSTIKEPEAPKQTLAEFMAPLQNLPDGTVLFDWNPIMDEAMRRVHARSTIKKPETIMPPKDVRHPGDYDVVCDRSTGKLYRYAKGVALDYQLDSVRRGNPYLEPKDWALPRWQQDKPKTREHVLEEALREMPCTCLFPLARDHVVGCPRGRADAALEWKPLTPNHDRMLNNQWGGERKP